VSTPSPRRAPRGGVWIAAALLALLSACSGDTDIIGRCEAVTEPQILLSGSNGMEYVWWSPSVGLLDDHVWVTYVQLVDARGVAFGRWYDAQTLLPASEPVVLGTYTYWELQQWVRDGDALVGQVWADPSEPAEITSDDQLVHLWRVTPPPALSATGRRVAINTFDPADDPTRVPGPWSAISLGAVYQPGFQGAIPIAVTDSGPVGALLAVAPCSGPLFGRLSVHVFDNDVSATRVPLPTAVCDFGGVTAPWLFPIDGDEVGLLYRNAASIEDHEVRYVRLGADGTPRTTSRIVGGGANVARFSIAGGYQPRGVRVREHVLFTERRGDYDQCYTIRVMGLDGEDAEDAPWQLPCADDEDGSPMVTWIHQLVSVPGAAVIVWGERANFDLEGADPTILREGVFAVMLTEDGKRGSAVMRLTDPAYTVFGGDTDVQVAADGNNIFATWIDLRSAEAEGYYARMISCTVDP